MIWRTTKRKINKLLVYLSNYDFIKSFYYRQRLNLHRSGSFHIYPKSIISIHKSAKLSIRNGEFAINYSFFSGRTRRYFSELRMEENSEIICEGDFKLIQGASIFVDKNAKLVLKGGWSFLNTNSTLNCFHYIEIGKGVSISDNVSIADSDSHSIDGKDENVKAPIIIKDNVWIAKNVIILKGVTIGEGAVIGAGSVVTKDVPEHTLVAGNPARFIRKISIWN